MPVLCKVLRLFPEFNSTF